MSDLVTPKEVVDALFDSVKQDDIDGPLALVTDDLEYHNMPVAPVYGPQGLKKALEYLHGIVMASTLWCTANWSRATP